MENKTALQELIEILNKSQKFINDNDSKEDKYYRSGLREAIEVAKNLIPTEKNKMIEFGNKMQIIDDVDFDGFVTFFYEPEDYYNKTYNK